MRIAVVLLVLTILTLLWQFESWQSWSMAGLIFALLFTYDDIASRIRGWKLLYPRGLNQNLATSSLLKSAIIEFAITWISFTCIVAVVDLILHGIGRVFT